MLSARKRRQVLESIAAGTLGALLPGITRAQGGFPNRPVRIVVPFAPGGGTDIVARLLGQKLTDLWGQTIVIENRAGAGGNIGADTVAKAAPDGYTLLMTSGSIVTVNPHIYKSMPFDALKDLLPITNCASGPMLISINPSVPANNLKEFIALARSKPGEFTFGSAGIGSQVHMAVENFAHAAGLQLRHVPYRGESAAINDLAGGQIHLMAGNLSAALGFAVAGKIRALAVTSKERARQLPDVPTASEAGLPGFENTGWFGLMAPAGTPREIVQKVAADTLRALDNTDARARMYVNGLVPVANSPEVFAKAIQAEWERWQKIVRERNLNVQ